MIKIKLGHLKHLIRDVCLALNTQALASGTDPDGFYPYDIERGVDIHSFWAASPGDKGNNPMRPKNAKEYIGQVKVGEFPDDSEEVNSPESENSRQPT